MKHYKGRPGGCTTRRRKSINKRMATQKRQHAVMGVSCTMQHDVTNRCGV